jgi:hypothetical protein
MLIQVDMSNVMDNTVTGSLVAYKRRNMIDNRPITITLYALTIQLRAYPRWLSL